MAVAIPGAGRNGSLDEQALLSEFLVQIDEARVVPRPQEVGTLYVELEYRRAMEEQHAAYLEKAAEETRESDRLAAESEYEAAKSSEVSDRQHALADSARARLQRDEAVLRPHARRRTDAKAIKWIRWGLLILGDLGGVAGAALLLGELPINALMQASSAAVSAVTFGIVGSDVRYLVAARARQRPAEELSEAEAEYASWFVGPQSGERLVKIIALVCLTGMALIAGGIFGLRYTALGTNAAVAYCCISLALGLASFCNCYDTADEVAEHLEAGASVVHKLDREAAKARKDPIIGRRQGALAEASSIRAANAAGAEAAAAGLERSLYRMLGGSPGVAGHGLPPTKGGSR